MSETLEITKENVLQAYKNANNKGKGLLTDLFGKKVFQGSIKDRVKSYEDACEELGLDPEDQLPFMSEEDGNDDEFQLSINAYTKLCIIAKALNEGWIPDFKDTNEYKWFPWFRVTSAGFGFSSTLYSASNAYANFGSRLCVKSDSLAEYFGTHFVDIWEVYLMNNVV
ncbi:hypothetical protein [Albibacterium profundi]|uniref:Uncharacterized protein n=1 Tax=Albibacterium profundi TaxID=3134906 RepID=A0ABV5CFI4_9SPHI